ncbi:outer membrane lipoprotein carrier protein LolA [Microbacterium sp. NPDC056736]|uniref:LolA family protein n=1 Tax=Microbacterium sp. NPDC056736 TaxID=3345932 RepID=UPI00366ECED3
MSSPRRVLDRRPVAWVAAIAAPIVVGAAVLVPMAASGAVDLPDKSVAELIAFASASEVDALSGTIEQSSELGLPDLAGLTGGPRERDDGPRAAEVDDLIALVTGSHTANVYLDGDQARLQVLDQLGERNVYVDHDAGEAWFVDSESQTATRLALPAGASPGAGDAGRALPTPDRMLDEALARLDATTEVTVGTDARVAGREVYELLIVPRTEDTLVGEVRFAIDGQNGAALAASVTARGASAPAFEIAFTRIDFSAPAPDTFAFEPGADMVVVEKDLTRPDDAEHEGDAEKGDAAPAVIGEGWATVVALTAADGSGVPQALEPAQLAMLERVTTAVEGGRALQTSLVSVLFTDDGRVLAGAVPAARLVEAARTGR